MSSLSLSLLVGVLGDLVTELTKAVVIGLCSCCFFFGDDDDDPESLLLLLLLMVVSDCFSCSSDTDT